MHGIKLPKDQARIYDRLGPTWCFKHNQPNSQSMPCEACEAFEKAHPFEGRCFDCKAEFAAKGEPGTRCGCGSRVRATSAYRYP